MNLMKHALAIAVALTATVVWLPAARGADLNASAPPAGSGGATAWRDRMQEAAKDLNLTDEQKEKLKPIFRSATEKARAVQDDASLSPPERTQKLKALREESAPEVKKVLTPEQFEKWQSLQNQAPGLRLQDAIKELDLTDAQKEKLKAILQAPMEKIRALRADASLTWQQKLEKFKAARAEVMPKVKEVLSAEQFAKYQQQADRVQEEIKQRFQQQCKPD